MFQASPASASRPRRSSSPTMAISKPLVTLECNMSVNIPLDDLRLAPFDAKRLIAFLKALEFTTITKRVAEAYGVDPAGIEADPLLALSGTHVAAEPSSFLPQPSEV